MDAQELQDTQSGIKPKSVLLEPDEQKKLKKFVDNCHTKQEAVKKLGLRNRGTLRSILNSGSGSHDNITLIREKISSAA